MVTNQNLADFAGNVLKVGDKVAVSIMVRRWAALRLCEVVEIDPTRKNDPVRVFNSYANRREWRPGSCMVRTA